MNVIVEERKRFCLFNKKNVFFKRRKINQNLHIMANSGKGFTLGLITGAAIGSIVALLYAPDSGSNLRGKVTYRVSTYGDEINRLIKKLKVEKEKIASDAKQKGDDVVSDAKKRADDLIKEAEALLDNIERTKPKN